MAATHIDNQKTLENDGSEKITDNEYNNIMRIVFNLRNVGLGNNGGTKTLVRCAETLQTLGAEVSLSVNHPVKYTWSKVKVPIVRKIPNADVIIATGYNSVKSTLRSTISSKYYYIRGFETWQVPPKKLIKSYKSLRCIVNSQWLHSYLASVNVSSRVIYPGLDFDQYVDNDLHRDNIMGAIFHSKHKTKRHCDALLLSQQCQIKLQLLNRDIKNATSKDLRRFYNKCKVWFSPTELEGLHNPPMEAALCGCALVCTDHLRSGMGDYAIHNETALVYPARNLSIAAKYVKDLLNNEKKRRRLNGNLREILRAKIGDRCSNMRKLLEWIS